MQTPIPTREGDNILVAMPYLDGEAMQSPEATVIANRYLGKDPAGPRRTSTKGSIADLGAERLGPPGRRDDRVRQATFTRAALSGRSAPKARW